MPGLVMEKIDSEFVKESLTDLPYGVVVISGTNGKTSTTKMAVELLQAQGLVVFTNNTGSNFLRGIGSSLLKECDLSGKIKADIAVLELDEAHAVHFVAKIKPRYSLLLNVMRDQLDRFGELDNVAQMLNKIALATTDKVIINQRDSHLAKLGSKLDNASYYSFSEQIKDKFSSLDDEEHQLGQTALVELIDSQSNQARYKIDSQVIDLKTKISGIYNHYNLAGAILLVKTILGDKLDNKKLLTAAQRIKPAFGRGESFVIDDKTIELVLVKNPSGFQMSLNSLTDKKAAIMIAINDNYADGRDTSWLWDVDFSKLPKQILATAGTRSKEIANRLHYDEKQVQYSDESLSEAVEKILAAKQSKRQIFATYTAMLKTRKLLKKAQGKKDGKFD